MKWYFTKKKKKGFHPLRFIVGQKVQTLVEALLPSVIPLSRRHHLAVVIPNHRPFSLVRDVLSMSVLGPTARDTPDMILICSFNKILST